MHSLERTIILNVTRDALWDFIATPANLNQLTPPELNFQILSDVPERMFNGLTFLYDIRIPLIGRRRWLTEIKHIRDGVSFVDEQRMGPYSYWYHYHEVEAIGTHETRMIDRVHYCLPFEPISLPVQRLWVRKMLNKVFDYRAEKLYTLFDEERPLNRTN